jgi:hypothetical protein
MARGRGRGDYESVRAIRETPHRATVAPEAPKMILLASGAYEAPYPAPTEAEKAAREEQQLIGAWYFQTAFPPTAPA